MYCSNQIDEDMRIVFAHEVKNPVSLIKAHIELLELDTKLSVYEKNICLIKRELNKISYIVSEYILSHSPAKNIENVNIIAVIKEILRGLEIYNKKNIKFYFELNCDEDDFIINYEHFKLCILLNNIYKNAVESIGEEGIIKTKLYNFNNKKIIEIIDSGEGLSKLNDENTPFYSKKQGGTGLGISICQKIVEEIGGKFEIFNNKEKGCTVKLTF